jgi:hypothetical protein
MSSFTCSTISSSCDEDMLSIPKSGKIIFHQPLDYHIDNGIAIMVLSKINDFNLEEHESTHMVIYFLLINFLSVTYFF